MADERDPNLENAVWRLEQRLSDAFTILDEHKADIAELKKALAKAISRLEWLEWQRQENRNQTKALLPLAERVSALDSWVVKLLIGAILSAFLGWSFSNFAIFGGF